MLNAFVGWYQEKQAGDIVEQLKAGIAMKAIVRCHPLGLTSSLIDDVTHTRSFEMGKSKKLRPARSSRVISPSSRRGKRSLRMGRYVNNSTVPERLSKANSGRFLPSTVIYGAGTLRQY